MNNSTNRYRRVIAYVLIPENTVNPLCPANDLWSMLEANNCEVAKATFTDNDIYNEQGQVVEKGADEGSVVMAKIGPAMPAGRRALAG